MSATPQAGAVLGAAEDQVTLGVMGMGSLGVQIEGTFSGTLSFEGALEGSYVALNMHPPDSTSSVTTTTDPGIWVGSIAGLRIVRVRMSSYASGAAKVSLQAAAVALVLAVSGGGGGMAIGDPVTSGVDDDVLFVNASGNLSQDNAFKWKQASHSLGLGEAPQADARQIIQARVAGDRALVIKRLDLQTGDLLQFTDEFDVAKAAINATFDFGTAGSIIAVGTIVAIGTMGASNLSGTNTGDQTIPVTSVFTRTGAIVAVSGDYTAAQVTNAFDRTAAATLTEVVTPTSPGAGFQKVWASTSGLKAIRSSGVTYNMVLPDAGAANQFLTAISSSGVISKAQPTEANLSLSDITTNDATSTKHGLVPKTPGDATKFLNGAATAAFAAVKESDLSTSDITTNDVTSTKHGLSPKSPADATQFLNGAATPAYAQVKDSDLATTDVTTNNVVSTKHGFTPKSPADATQFLNGAATPAFAAVKDSDLATTDVTTNNATTAKHGFLKKLDNSAVHFMDGQGNWSTPAAAITITQVEVDFGNSVNVVEVTTTVTDAAVSATSKLLLSVAGDAPTGGDADDVMVQDYQLSAVPVSGSFDLTARCIDGPTNGKLKVNYLAA